MPAGKPRKNSRGVYERNLGWKPRFDAVGLPDYSDLMQHRFYLGTDEHEARLREIRLEQLWRLVEARWKADRSNGLTISDQPLWDEVTIEIGMAISHGENTVVIDPCSDLPDDPQLQARWFTKLQRDFPIIGVVPANKQLIDQGIADDLEKANTHTAWTKRIRQGVGKRPSLHAALDDYAEWIRGRAKYQVIDHDSQRRLSGWGNTQRRQVNRLKEHHADIPLDELNLAKIEEFYEHWLNRPCKKGTEKPIKASTARNQRKQLKAFLKWLHRSEAYDWRKPVDLEELDTKPVESSVEKAGRLTPVQAATWSVEELGILYAYATPWERCLLLLGLNCGFAEAEIGSLLLKEVRLFQQHPAATVLRITSTPADSFIGRIRQKTGVYGEWKLWPITEQAIQWQLARRGDIQPDDLVFLSTRSGQTLTAPTASGNHSTKIASRWDSLIKRIQKDHTDFRRLSFAKLRKTACDLIRHFSDGEIMAVFHSRGQPVRTDKLSDIYSNRPFGKVFHAIELVGQHLAPVIATVEHPFPVEEKKGGPNISLGTIKKIRTMKSQGFKITAIMEACNVSRTTVWRNLKASLPETAN